jgi:hypothetical protein
MSAILNAFGLGDPASLKRFILLALTAVVGLVSPWLSSKGVPVPSDGVLEGLAVLVAAFIAQSGYRSAQALHAEAAATATAQITTVEQARAILDAAAKGPTP